MSLFTASMRAVKAKANFANTQSLQTHYPSHTTTKWNQMVPGSHQQGQQTNIAVHTYLGQHMHNSSIAQTRQNIR